MKSSYVVAVQEGFNDPFGNESHSWVQASGTHSVGPASNHNQLVNKETKGTKPTTERRQKDISEKIVYRRLKIDGDVIPSIFELWSLVEIQTVASAPLSEIPTRTRGCCDSSNSGNEVLTSSDQTTQ